MCVSDRTCGSICVACDEPGNAFDRLKYISFNWGVMFKFH